MAKQTFTTGQVLTAAQLTSLQQTAMLGGAASAKTASYTLVAADAGTTISMTSTSATTITVNTGLFAAGDTVFIQNLGSGNLTITAGTATVATAGSLILPQNDAGILYFVSTSSSVFYDFIQVGAASPLTTKGDLYGFSTSDARIPIGANGTILTADSTESLGLKWATPASGGGMTLINSGGTALSGASVTISSIPSTYVDLHLYIVSPVFDATAQGYNIQFRFNGDTASNYATTDTTLYRASFGSTAINLGGEQGSGSNGTVNAVIPYYAQTGIYKSCRAITSGVNSFTSGVITSTTTTGFYNQTGAITSISLSIAAGNFTSGTAYLYGVK